MLTLDQFLVSFLVWTVYLKLLLAHLHQLDISLVFVQYLDTHEQYFFSHNSCKVVRLNTVDVLMAEHTGPHCRLSIFLFLWSQLFSHYKGNGVEGPKEYGFNTIRNGNRWMGKKMNAK